jgi:hypothetical protein
MTPHPDDNEPTVAMPVRAAEDAALHEIIVRRAASRRARKRRRLALAAIAGSMFVVGIAAGWFFFPRSAPRSEKPVAAPAPPAPEVARSVSPPAPSPAPRAPDKALSPKQMLDEIFDGRERAHSVTVAVDGGAVRIGSSRPGYVYVLAASTHQAVGAPLFVARLFPRAADTNNRVRPGQTLKLPDLEWPANAELLAIVSDAPRDIDVLGSLAGRVVCPSAARCSESYGAVVFTTERLRETVRRPLAPKAQAVAPPAPAGPRRCSDILERASLGEVLTAEEYSFLRRECR